MPLDDIKTKVGPLEPPAQWADDLCSLEGIDYGALRTPLMPGSDAGVDGGEPSVINGFANEYIGDYVQKLSDFVEYYNIQYPLHEGDDVRGTHGPRQVPFRPGAER